MDKYIDNSSTIVKRKLKLSNNKDENIRMLSLPQKISKELILASYNNRRY